MTPLQDNLLVYMQVHRLEKASNTQSKGCDPHRN